MGEGFTGMNLVFFVPCSIPGGTSQQKGASIITPRGGGRPFIHWFVKKEIMEAEKQWTAALYSYRPAQPFTGPVSLTLGFVYPWRKAEKKGIVEKFHRFPIETRPDVENVAKLCIDVMAKLKFFEDDSQISSLHLHKHYGDEPGLGVTLTRASAETRMGVKTQV